MRLLHGLFWDQLPSVSESRHSVSKRPLTIRQVKSLTLAPSQNELPDQLTLGSSMSEASSSFMKTEVRLRLNVSLRLDVTGSI